MDLSILIQGQSNAALFYSEAFAAPLAAEAQLLLGFDGVANRVVIIGGADVSAFPGTPLLPGLRAAPGAVPWLRADPAHPAQPWSAGPEQRTLDAYLAALPPARRASPTAIVWIHNEYDSFNPAITPAEWAGGVAYSIAAERAALGQSAATTPVAFVTVPYDAGAATLETVWRGGSAQQLKQGFRSLVDDPGFNAAWGAQAGDSNMDGTDRSYGGEHFDRADLAQLAHRLARSIASRFSRYARPGAPLAAGGALDDAGPAVASAKLVAEQPGQVLVRLALPPGAGGLRPLSAAAAAGAGWSLQGGPEPLFARAAQLRAGDGILLTFPRAIPAGAPLRLFYGYGSGRICRAGTPAPGPGRGAAVYDGTGLPLQPTAEGIPLGSGPAAVVTLGDGPASVAAREGPLDVAGGTGPATVAGGTGRLTVRGGLGRVEVRGGAGALLAAGGLQGHNVLAAGPGDALLIGAHDDTLRAGSGAATIYVGAGDNAVFGGTGAATVFAAAAAAGTVTVHGGAGRLAFYEGGGRNLFLGEGGAATIAGTAGQDVIMAGEGRTAVVGGSGGDTIIGGAAAETLVQGGSGPTWLAGGQGLTAFWAGRGPATILGGAGVTSVFAGPGDGPVQLAVPAGKAGGTAAFAGLRIGTDRVVLRGYPAAEPAHALAGATALGPQAVELHLSDGTRLTLRGVPLARLGEALFQ